MGIIQRETGEFGKRQGDGQPEKKDIITPVSLGDEHTPTYKILQTQVRFPQEIIHVLIGPSRKDFPIHKGFAYSRLPYFDARFNGESEESKTGVIIFGAKNPEVFGLLSLMNTNKIEELCTDKSKNRNSSSWEDKPTFQQMVDVRLLAEWLRAPVIQNRAMDYIAKKVAGGYIYLFREWNSKSIYKRTRRGNVLRKFLVDRMVASPMKSSKYVLYSRLFRTDMWSELFVEQKRILENGKDHSPPAITSYYV